MNKINSSKLRFLTVFALGLSLAGVASAQSTVAAQPQSQQAAAASGSAYFYQSPGSIGGKPANQIGALWWKWALAIPEPKNPLTDTTGVDCTQGQPNYTPNPATNIWWLGGLLEGGTVVRSCTVPLTRTLVFPIVNGAYFAFPDDLPAERTDAYIRQQVAYVQSSTGLSVTYDGQPLSNPARYYTQSANFSVKLPANNVYGLDAGQVFNPSVDAGYYVGVTVYVPGKHVLKFKGVVGGTPVDVTYNLTIKSSPF